MPDFAPPSTLRRSTAPVAAAGDFVGRFELLRVLGSGAQATVWLAFDPRLERQVAIKLLKDVGDDAAALAGWLREARNVGRLAHARIVGLHEADVHQRQPYLVFEYVAGTTLTAQLAQRGRMAPALATALMVDVLDGLGAAHAAGVVHRDLKPSNVIVDTAGRARVMDFGMAAPARPGEAFEHALPGGGTPAYMAPEAAAGAAPSALEDVFSAGLVLAEMLTGRPLVPETDSYRAIYRIAHEDLGVPADAGQPVDDALRAIVARALARDPAARWPGAQALRDALVTWAQPHASDAPAAGGASGTLEFLLRRMRHKSDFPALSDSVSRIQRMANSENDSIGDLTSEILKDVALTNKLLRLVNSVNYAHANRGAISTVSRAVTLVGFNAVRNMALSLVLLEHMQNKAHAVQLKEEFLRAMMAGAIAGELCTLARDSEEAFIGAMFQNLGRMLCEFYFPEEAAQIRSRSAEGGPDAGEDAAAVQVLGIGLEDLGVGVATSWGLPDSLLHCMRRPAGAPPLRVPGQQADRTRWNARAANDIASTLLWSEPAERALRLRYVAERFTGVVGMPVAAIEKSVGAAQQKLTVLADILNLKISPGTPAHRLLNEAGAPTAPLDLLQTHALRAADPPLPPAGTQAAPADARAVTDVLAAGIQDITNAMVESFKLNDVLRMILETMYRALGFRCIVFCLREPRTESMTGRFGLGDGAEATARAIRFPMKGVGDLFAAVCGRGADTLIADATEPRIAERLPAWYRQSVNAPAFLLLPLQMKGQPFGLIYADQAAPGAIVLDDKQLALLRTLRNQAVMAFRQAG